MCVLSGLRASSVTPSGALADQGSNVPDLVSSVRKLDLVGALLLTIRQP